MAFLSTANKIRSSRLQNQREHVSELVVDGFSLEVIRKDIKNVHLRVYPPDGKVRVSAPRWLSLKEIASIVGARREWLESQKESCTQRGSDPDYSNGEIHTLAGIPQVLRVSETRQQQSVMTVEAGFIDMKARKGSSSEQRKALLEGFYREKLVEQAIPLIEKWELRLEVEVFELRVKKMTTRWGSCNVVDHRVWLSLALATQPLECLEYVVVHELAHLIERGHGPEFIRVMDGALTDWRVVKRQLNGRKT